MNATLGLGRPKTGALAAPGADVSQNGPFCSKVAGFLAKNFAKFWELLKEKLNPTLGLGGEKELGTTLAKSAKPGGASAG
jgi:hypothetical protein